MTPITSSPAAAWVGLLSAMTVAVAAAVSVPPAAAPRAVLAAAPVPAVVPSPAVAPAAPGRTTTPASGPTRTPGPPTPGARWLFPLQPRPAVVSPFSAPPDPYAAGHRGVDLAASVGEVVGSPTVGTVTFAGPVAGRPVLVVAHPGGLRSTLEPVAATVRVGVAVGPGAPVGTVAGGPGHCAPATCLHWGVLRGTTYLDPLRFVSTPRVVLLPLSP